MPPTPAVTVDVSAELDAMRTAIEAIEPLDENSRGRAIRYVADLFGIPLVAQLDEDAIVKAAAGWASEVLDMVDAKALKQATLDGLGFGDDPDITDTLLANIKAAWRMAAGTEEARALWPST